MRHDLWRNPCALMLSVVMLIGGSHEALGEGKKNQEAPSLSVIDLRFPGGTVAEYIEAVQKTAGDAVNVIVTNTPADRLRFPPVELKRVDVGAALSLVDGEYELEDGSSIILGVSWLGSGKSDSAPIARIRSTRTGKMPVRDVHVWSLGFILSDGDVSPDDVLTAVEVAVDLSRTEWGGAEVRFHEPTALLIASGSRRSLEAIDRVIDQLQVQRAIRREEAAHDDAEVEVAPPAPEAPEPPEVRRLMRRLRQQQRRIQTLERQLEKASPRK